MGDPQERRPVRKTPRSPGGKSAPSGRRGPAASVAEFSQPLLDAAGHDEQSPEKALTLGMLFWNLAASAEAMGDGLIREQLPEVERRMCRTQEDCREFRGITRMMFERYERMRPNKGTDLVGILEDMWDEDFSSDMPRLGWVHRAVGAARRLFLRRMPRRSDDPGPDSGRQA